MYILFLLYKHYWLVLFLFTRLHLFKHFLTYNTTLKHFLHLYINPNILQIIKPSSSFTNIDVIVLVELSVRLILARIKGKEDYSLSVFWHTVHQISLYLLAYLSHFSTNFYIGFGHRNLQTCRLFQILSIIKFF